MEYKNFAVSTNKSLYLANDTRYRYSYYGRRIGTQMRSIKWCHLQWPWTNPNPIFKVTPFFDAEYLTNGYIYGHSCYRSRIKNRTDAFEWQLYSSNIRIAAIQLPTWRVNQTAVLQINSVYYVPNITQIGQYLYHHIEMNNNLAIANRSRVSCAHNKSKASISLITEWPWNLG